MKKFFAGLSLFLILVLFPQVTASTAVLEASPTTVYVMDEPVGFDGSGSDPSVGNIVKYYFDYGDGLSSGWIDSPVIKHQYQHPGSYYAKLKVKDDYEDKYTQESPWSAPVAITVKGQSPVVDERPLTLGLVADPVEIGTGGERSTIIVTLLRGGDEVEAPLDTRVLLDTTLGKITPAIVIQKGKSQGMAALESSLKSGTAEIMATSEGLTPGYVEVEFTVPPEERVMHTLRLVLESDISSLPSDSESTSTVTVILADDEGNPVAAEEDITVYLKATGGQVKPPFVTIREGESFTTLTFISPEESGMVRIFATSRGLEEGMIEMEIYPLSAEPDYEEDIIILLLGVVVGTAVVILSRKEGYFKIEIKPRLVKEEFSVDGGKPLFEKPRKVNEVSSKALEENTALLFSQRQMDIIANKALENTLTPLRFRLANFLAGPNRINDDEVIEELKEFFRIDICELLIRIWKKAHAIQELRDREKYPCENTYQLTLLTQEMRSTCELSLDVLLNGVRVLRIPFELDIELNTKGFKMWIRCGRIVRLFSGSMKGTVSIKTGAFKIMEKDIDDIKIPGEVSFKDGIEIPKLL